MIYSSDRVTQLHHLTSLTVIHSSITNATYTTHATSKQTQLSYDRVHPRPKISLLYPKPGCSVWVRADLPRQQFGPKQVLKLKN